MIDTDPPEEHTFYRIDLSARSMPVLRACIECPLTYSGELRCPSCGAPGEPLLQPKPLQFDPITPEPWAEAQRGS